MISTTLTKSTSGRVRNVSETEISAMSTKDTLMQLLTITDTLIGYSEKQELYTDMAERLSKIAHKNPAWGWRYVQSVQSGTVEPSQRFAKAVDVLAVSMDGIPVPFANAVPVTVYAEAGTVKAGALVMGSSVTCANPKCLSTFVPNVPWRRMCPGCNPVREKSAPSIKG